jgi:hypothetical protein
VLMKGKGEKAKRGKILIGGNGQMLGKYESRWLGIG